MIQTHPQFVVDENKQPCAVILPMSDWESIVEELDELEDIRAYDEAKADPQESLPLDDALREIEEGRVD